MGIVMSGKKNRSVSSCPHKPTMRMTLKLFAYLGIFTVIALVVVWLFQVAFMNVFYKKTKLGELEEAEQAIAAAIDDGNERLQNVAYQYAIDYSMCVRIFRLDSEEANDLEEILSLRVSRDSLLAGLDKNSCRSYCRKAIAQNGIYVRSTDLQIPERRIEGQPDGEESIISKERTVTNTIYVAVERQDAGVYAILLDSQLTPLSATVITLQQQFIWIMMILLPLALLLAIAMSGRLTRPIVRMNAEARQLASGDYTVRFSGGSYREAEELAESLNYAASELAKTDNQQKELLANVSHDLRTPLTMIVGYAEVMRDIPGESTPENIQVIIDESQRLSSLVNDLLDLSRLRAGTRKMENERFNLTDTVRDVMLRYEKLTEHDGYRIEFIADTPVDIIADRTSILQVIYNLINNAINYAGKDKYVCVRQQNIGDHVRISVEDHGAGIAPEDIPMIWDRYYKVDRVHRRAMVGTGLGLAIVKGVLELYGDAYGVESKLGEGSTFWFDLPVAPTELRAEEVLDGK